jgi:hypothetical protein
MLEEVLRRETFKALFDKSHFKKSQLDALLVRRYALRNHLKLKDVVSLRDKKTSLGSMERSAFQAEGVIAESIATLILALGLDLVSANVVESIPKLASLLEQSSMRKLSDDELQRFLALLSALLQNASHK